MNNKGKEGNVDEGAAGKVQRDERGRNVWVEPVESGDFDLISTQDLKQILDSGDDDNIRAIEEVAAGSEDGVVVRNASTGMFRVIDENELQAMLANDRARQKELAPPEVGLEPLKPGSGDGEELSLVSTQALRKIIKPETPEPAADEHRIGAELDDLPDRGGGFNPYDSN